MPNQGGNVAAGGLGALHVVLEAQQIDLDVLPDLTDMGRYSEVRRELLTKVPRACRMLESIRDRN